MQSKVDIAPSGAPLAQGADSRYPLGSGSDEQAAREGGEPLGGGAGLALVVDDEWLVLETLVGYCELLGLIPVPANGGEEALRLLDDHPGIGVLISDVRMPGIDGVELARRAAARRPDLKVVLTTGYAQVDGAPWPLLPKPYSVQDLGRALRAVGVPAAANGGGSGDAG